MPIRYLFDKLHDFMSFKLKNSYVAAMDYIYGLDLLDETAGDPNRFGYGKGCLPAFCQIGETAARSARD